MKSKIILIGLALSLCVYYFFAMLSALETPRHYDGNVSNLYLFIHDSSHPLVDTNLEGQFPIWKTRPLPQWMTGKIVDFTIRDGISVTKWNGYNFPNYVVAFASWQAGWLLLTLVTIIGFCWREPLKAAFLSLIVYAGLTYENNIVAGAWYFPWDAPILFFFTWATLAWFVGKKWRLEQFYIATICACAFKETGLVLCLLPFLTLKIRSMVYAVVLGMVGLLFRDSLMHLFHSLPGFLPYDGASHGFFMGMLWNLWKNTAELLSFHLNSFVFIGGGLLVMLFGLAKDWETKVFVGAFVLGHWLFGIGIEFRDFNELLCLVALVAYNTLKEEKCVC